MKSIPDASIDMVLADLPYGTTACSWDSVIPFEPLWSQYRRVVKPRTALVFTASMPFTASLVASNPKWFRYEWIWAKGRVTGFLDANRKPLKNHESILVFGEKPPFYRPQMGNGKPYVQHRKAEKASQYGSHARNTTVNKGDRFPTSILEIHGRDKPSFHPTQKPISLLEYLIKTYTDEGMTVLDNVMGSGSTGVACINTNRSFVGIEKSGDYFNLARKRITEVADQSLLHA